MELFVGEVVSGGKRHFIGFVHDLTAAREGERQLSEMQSELVHISRLSSMGEMASALAHELNQPLTAVANYLEGSKRLMKNSRDPRAPVIIEAMGKAAEQAIRAGQIIQRLRDFITRGETEHRTESIKTLVEASIGLALIAVKDASVRVELRMAPTVDLVLVDKVQIQQVLLNLLRNAFEAMQDSERRELVVSTFAADNNMVAVEVADTGGGHFARNCGEALPAVRYHEEARHGRRTVDFPHHYSVAWRTNHVDGESGRRNSCSVHASRCRCRGTCP